VGGGEGRLSKNIPGFQDAMCSVPDVVTQKSAFQGSWFSNNQ